MRDEPQNGQDQMDDVYLSRIVPLPPSGDDKWALYDNPEHQFAFQYPDRWQLLEIPGETRELSAPSPLADAVLLKNGVFELTIWFNKINEDRSFLKMVTRGDRYAEDPITFLGESLPVIAIKSGGATTAILYGDEHFWAGDLHFSIALLDISEGQEAGPEIPPRIKNDVVKILGSLVASSVDYIPSHPAPIVDDLPCNTVDSSSAGWTICNVRDALISGNLSTLSQWVDDPFPFGFWGSEYVLQSPQEMIQALRRSHLPANTAGLTFTVNQDVFPPLAGIPPERMLGPDVLITTVVYSEGWGQDGVGAALLLFGPDELEQTKLRSIVLARQHFDR